MVVGRSRRRLTSLEKANSLKPGSAEILRGLAALSVETNDLDGAIGYQAKLSAADRSPELLYNIAIALQDTNRPEEAAKLYQEAIGLNPGFAEAHLNLGHALKSLGRHDEAKASWDIAIQTKPELATDYF